MKLQQFVIDMILENTDYLPLSLTESWKSLKDDYGHNHCSNCGFTVTVGIKCLVKYFKYTSIVFCLQCYYDNKEIMENWMRSR
jgi:hypothetical protein